MSSLRELNTLLDEVACATDVEDDLLERVEAVKEEYLGRLKSFLLDAEQVDAYEFFYKQYGEVAIQEIASNQVPTYHTETAGLYELHNALFEEAYVNSELGNGDEENHEQVTIYAYLCTELANFNEELESRYDVYKKALSEADESKGVHDRETIEQAIKKAYSFE